MAIAGDVGACLTGAAAALALPLAFRQIRLARKTAKEERAYSYMDRLNDPAMQRILARARDFWEVGPERGIPAWKGLDRNARLEIVLPMNIFEELAQVYEEDLVDRRIVKQALGYTSKFYYGEAKWLIDWYRLQAGPDADPGDPPWAKWQHMNSSLDEPSHTWHGIGEPWPPPGAGFS